MTSCIIFLGAGESHVHGLAAENGAGAREAATNEDREAEAKKGTQEEGDDQENENEDLAAALPAPGARVGALREGLVAGHAAEVMSEGKDGAERRNEIGAGTGNGGQKAEAGQSHPQGHGPGAKKGTGSPKAGLLGCCLKICFSNSVPP